MPVLEKCGRLSFLSPCKLSLSHPSLLSGLLAQKQVGKKAGYVHFFGLYGDRADPNRARLKYGKPS
jgi:hypothetical protein